MARLLLLCERGGFAPLHQAVSAAAAALASGGSADLVLFHAALGRYLAGAVDDIQEDSYREQIGSGRVRPVSAMLQNARADGLGLYACSASLALLGREGPRDRDQLDEVVGWPTILRWMDQADHVLYL